MMISVYNLLIAQEESTVMISSVSYTTQTNAQKIALMPKTVITILVQNYILKIVYYAQIAVESIIVLVYILAVVPFLAEIKKIVIEKAVYSCILIHTILVPVVQSVRM